MIRGRAVAAAGTILAASLGAAFALTPAPAKASQQLVYICQATPCTNAQEFEVSDANGAPIFSVGEFGGASVLGDKFSVFPPGGNIFATPPITVSGDTPAQYAAANNIPDTCSTEEARWLAPDGDYSCESGTWSRVWNLP